MNFSARKSTGFGTTVSVALALFTACTSAPTRPDSPYIADGKGSGEVMGPQEPFGPPVPPPPALASPYGPEPGKRAGIVLVFGPGRARGFAHAGVVRAFHEAKIPIAAVLGTEMGGLIGGIYAVDGNINHFEWSLLRLKSELFGSSNALLSKVFNESGKSESLDRELRKIFDSKEIEKARIPFRAAVKDVKSGKIEVLDRGELVGAVRAAVAIPGVFSPSKVGALERVSAETTRPFLVREARALGLGLVVAVDLGNGSQDPELSEADLVIRPDLSGIGAGDYEKKSEAAFRGKKAAALQVTAIRNLLGGRP